MNQVDFSLVDKINIDSDALIINQCNDNGYLETYKDSHTIKLISINSRGLSKSRNEAIRNATGDICILCDDDVRYKDEYVQIIKNAFEELPKADIIVFNTDMLNYSSIKTQKPIVKKRKAPRNRYYGSVRIAFRLESFKKNNIGFDIDFGAGSIFSSGEESLMLKKAFNKGLKIYEYPATIAEVDYSESTWFTGYNEKFFHDIGAWLVAAYPKMYPFVKYYYPLSFKGCTKLTKSEIVSSINMGVKAYKLYNQK